MELLAPVKPKEESPADRIQKSNPTPPEPEIVADDTESIIRSIFEVDGNSNKSRYLGYKASGFSVRESLRLTGIHEKTLHRWRDGDPVFVVQENKLPELRKTLGVNFAHLEFLRNMRLFLEKDYQILQKSLRTPNPTDPATIMTKSEQDYLLRIRSIYTPQQLEVMGALIGVASESHQPIDFTKLILSISQSKSEIRVEGK